MKNLLFAVILLLQAPSVRGGVCDGKEPMSAQDWVIGNICHFKNTVLVEVKSDLLRGWYNPLTHFRSPNTFEYEVKVLEVFRGEGLNISCMLQSTEATFRVSAGIAGTQQIVSFDDLGECIVIDVGARQKATPELIRVAREVAKSINREHDE